MTGDAIEGVDVVALRRFADTRGTVLQMLNATDPHFSGFGEVYFSSVYPGVVKGWKRHRRMTVNYACILGRVKLVLYDDRGGSSTNGTVTELCLCPDEYRLVVIPPLVWHGFQGAGQPAPIVANCASEPSDPDELDRLDSGDGRIPCMTPMRASRRPRCRRSHAMIASGYAGQCGARFLRPTPDIVADRLSQLVLGTVGARRQRALPRPPAPR